MANRYWLPFAGTWSGTATTNWSTSSAITFTASRSGTALTTTGSPALVVGMTVITAAGANLGTIVSGSGNSWVTSGTGTVASTTMFAATIGASAPTASDSVFFDQANTYTVTLTTAPACLDLNVSAGTVTFSSTGTPTISGSMSLVAGTVWSATGTITFNATTSGKTVTTNGTSISASMTFNGSGGVWTLGSALTMGGVTLSVLAGTFDTSSTNNYAVTVSGSGNGTFTLNGGTANLNASTFSIQNTINLTSGNFNAGTSQVTLLGSSPTLTATGYTFYNFSFTNTGAVGGASYTGSNTFNNFTYTNAISSSYKSLTFSGNQTINGTLTVVAGTDATCRTLFSSSTAGSAVTLTCGAVSLTDVDFQDITIAGAAAPASGTRIGNAAGNSGITFTTPKTVYWNLAGAQNWSATGWATSSGGTPAVNNFPLPQDTAIFDNTGSVTGTITFNTAYSISTVDMSARTNAMTLATNTSISIYGNWANGTGTTLSGTNNITFASRGTQTISGAGQPFTQTIILNSTSGTLRLLGAVTTSRASSPAFGLQAGTLDLNGFTLTLSSSSSGSFGITTAGVKNLTFNGGSIVISTSGSVFQTGGGSNFTTTAGTGVGSISLTSVSAKTFNGNGYTFNCTLNNGGAGVVTITGANTLNNISNTFGSTGATGFTFPSGSTTTVADFTATGTTGNVLTLNSSTAGTLATVALNSGGTVTTPNYLSVQDIAFTPFTTNGTAAMKWYGGANSTNSGNVTGMVFAASTVGVYVLASGSSWTPPGNWNSSSNTIHIFGGGGGGGGGRAATNNHAAGGGGGGGGYTQLTNQSVSGPVTYAIGAAGTAGATAGGTGGTGGTTTWNSGAVTAAGGVGGSTTAGPTSTGGTGGVGSTATGGAGGAGNTNTSATATGSGGGGGAGGPNGTGGAGGAGSATAGGGGGGNGGGSAGAAGGATGGTGGNNSLGTGGGAIATKGTLGGGGGGGTSTQGIGSVGVDVSNTTGSGGGAGGIFGNVGVSTNTTSYGGGGAGGGTNTTTSTTAGGVGGQGVIVIVYSTAASGNTSNFFMMF